MKLIKRLFKRLIAIVILIIVLFMALQYVAYKIQYPYKYREYIDKYSQEYNLDPLLVLSVMKAESKFNPGAKSNKDAYGLMQITESTALDIAEDLKIQDFTTERLYEEELNIRMGSYYLSKLLKEFKNTEVALAAYNGGIGNVKKWLGNLEYSKDGESLSYIPFKETDKYVKKIRVSYNVYIFLYRQLPELIPNKLIIFKEK